MAHAVSAELGVRSDLPANELAQFLADRRPIDRAVFVDAIEALDGPPISEHRMLDLVRSIEEMLQRKGR